MSRLSDIVQVFGGGIFALPILSEAELEFRVGTGAVYKHIDVVREHLISFHGGSYFVGNLDYWRHGSVIYLMALGMLMILTGRHLEKRR